MTRDILRIDLATCIDCGLCGKTCAFGVIVFAFTEQHYYEIMPDRCHCDGSREALCGDYRFRSPMARGARPRHGRSLSHAKYCRVNPGWSASRRGICLVLFFSDTLRLERQLGGYH